MQFRKAAEVWQIVLEYKHYRFAARDNPNQRGNDGALNVMISSVQHPEHVLADLKLAITRYPHYYLSITKHSILEDDSLRVTTLRKVTDSKEIELDNLFLDTENMAGRKEAEDEAIKMNQDAASYRDGQRQREQRSTQILKTDEWVKIMAGDDDRGYGGQAGQITIVKDKQARVKFEDGMAYYFDRGLLEKTDPPKGPQAGDRIEVTDEDEMNFRAEGKIVEVGVDGYFTIEFDDKDLGRVAYKKEQFKIVK
jgi:hypothetical protein